MQFEILGPIRARSDGQSIEIGSPKQRSLLALLLIHANRTVSVDRIIDSLWGGESNGKEVGTLRVHVSNLRSQLEPRRPPGTPSSVILTEATGYRLRVDPPAIDSHRFVELAAEGRRSIHTDPEHAVAKLNTALELWRGPALDEVSYESFAQPEIRRLEELRLTATADLMEARLGLGEHEELVPELETLVLDHPLRERLWCLLMMALYRSGRQTDALAACRRLSDLLARDGLVPGPEVAALEDRILTNDPTLMSAERRPSSRLQPPAERSRLIGRDEDVGALAARLNTTRLLTLVGTGGVGKTRLAQRLAWSMISSGTEVWWVELEGVTDPNMVSAQIAAAGGLFPGPSVSVPELVERVLESRRAVLVLDNCEHLVEPIAAVVDRILARSPSVRIVTTSREPLQVNGETVWRVPSLGVPTATDSTEQLAACPSVELFVERARDRGVEIDDASLGTVGLIARRLDGIPLALELAAARVVSFAPAEISRRLESRFSLLDRGNRQALARHRTLEAAIDWSFRLLDEADRCLLGRLAVFVAGFDLDSARRVCGFDPLTPTQVERGIERLADKSLIDLTTEGRWRRFRLTESVKTFAWSRLVDDPEDLLSRHRYWAASLARDGSRGILVDEEAWLPRLDAAHPDLRAAAAEFLERGDHQLAIRTVGYQGSYLLWRRTSSALDWLEPIVEAARRQGSVEPADLAMGLLAIGPFLCYHDRFDQGIDSLAEAAAIYVDLDHLPGLMWARYLQSHFPASGTSEESVRLAGEAVAIARQMGDSVSIAYALARLAEARLIHLQTQSLPIEENWDFISDVCQEALGLCNDLPGAYAKAIATVTLGKAMALRGDNAGISLLVEGVERRVRYGRGIPCAVELVRAGQFALRFGHREQAAELIHRGLEAYHDLGMYEAIRPALVGAAEGLAETEPATAVRLLATALSLPDLIHLGVDPAGEQRLSDSLRSALGDELFDQEFALETVDPGEALETALRLFP